MIKTMTENQIRKVLGYLNLDPSTKIGTGDGLSELLSSTTRKLLTAQFYRLGNKFTCEVNSLYGAGVGIGKHASLGRALMLAILDWQKKPLSKEHDRRIKSEYGL